MTIADRIKSTRLSKEMSQSDLAKSAGYSDKSAISKLENSGDDITMKQIKRVASSLGVTSAYLMGWEDGVSEAEFDDYFEKTEETSRLKAYLDAFAKLSPRSQEEVLNYIDYQRSKDDTKKD